MISLGQKRYANNQTINEFNPEDYDYDQESVTFEDLLEYARLNSFNIFTTSQLFTQGASFGAQIIIPGITLVVSDSSGNFVKNVILGFQNLMTLENLNGNIHDRFSAIERNYVTTDTEQLLSATKKYQIDNSGNFVEITSAQISNVQYLDDLSGNVNDRFNAIEENYVTTDTEQLLSATKKYLLDNSGNFVEITSSQMTNV